MLLEHHPELGRLYRRHFEDNLLFDMRPQIAAAKALLDHYLHVARLDERVDPGGSDPATLRALAALQRIARMTASAVQIEKSLGVITHVDLDRALEVIAAVFHRFVPAERSAEARAALRERLTNVLAQGTRGEA